MNTGRSDGDLDKNEEILELIKDVLIPPSPERANDKLTVLEHTTILIDGANLTTVAYEIEQSNGKNQNGSIVLNGYPMNEEVRHMRQRPDYWERSERIYNEVLPALEELLVEYKEGKRIFWTKVFGTSDYVIIQEDVEKNGNYTSVSRLKPVRLNMAHSRLVMSTLGKLHGMSAVLGERKMIPVEKLTPSPFIETGLINDYYLRPFKTFTDTMEHYWGEEWVAPAEKIRNLSITHVSKISNLFKRDEGAFNALNIGECFVECLLFKYRSSDVIEGHAPEAMKFNCYRTAFYNSPGFDLQMFLSTSPNTDVMLNKRDELIKLYYDTLVSNLRKYKFKGNIPELKYIENELKRTAAFGLALSVTCLSQGYPLSPEEREVLEVPWKKKWKEEQILMRPEMMSEAFMEVMKGIIQKNLNEKIF